MCISPGPPSCPDGLPITSPCLSPVLSCQILLQKNPYLQWLSCKLRSFSESTIFCSLDRFLRNPLLNQETSFDSPHSLKESNHECIIRLLHPPGRSGLPHRSHLPHRTRFTHQHRNEEGRSFRQRRADYTDVTELAVKLA